MVLYFCDICKGWYTEDEATQHSYGETRKACPKCSEDTSLHAVPELNDIEERE